MSCTTHSDAQVSLALAAAGCAAGARRWRKRQSRFGTGRTDRLRPTWVIKLHLITIYIRLQVFFWTSKFDPFPFQEVVVCHLRSPCVQLQPQLRPLRPLRPWNMVSSQMGLSGHGIPVYGIPYTPKWQFEWGTSDKPWLTNEFRATLFSDKAPTAWFCVAASTLSTSDFHGLAPLQMTCCLQSSGISEGDLIEICESQPKSGGAREELYGGLPDGLDRYWNWQQHFQMYAATRCCVGSCQLWSTLTSVFASSIQVADDLMSSVFWQRNPRTNLVLLSTSPCGTFLTLARDSKLAHGHDKAPRTSPDDLFVQCPSRTKDTISTTRRLCHLTASNLHSWSSAQPPVPWRRLLRISYPFPWACAMWQMCFGWLIFVPLWLLRIRKATG